MPGSNTQKPNTCNNNAYQQQLQNCAKGGLNNLVSCVNNANHQHKNCNNNTKK